MHTYIHTLSPVHYADRPTVVLNAWDYVHCIRGSVCSIHGHLITLQALYIAQYTLHQHYITPRDTLQ